MIAPDEATATKSLGYDLWKLILNVNVGVFLWKESYWASGKKTHLRF